MNPIIKYPVKRLSPSDLLHGSQRILDSFLMKNDRKNYFESFGLLGHLNGQLLWRLLKLLRQCVKFTRSTGQKINLQPAFIILLKGSLLCLTDEEPGP